MMSVNLSVLEASLTLAAGSLLGLLIGWLFAKYRLTPSLVKSKTEADAHLEALQNKVIEIEVAIAISGGSKKLCLWKEALSPQFS